MKSIDFFADNVKIISIERIKFRFLLYSQALKYDSVFAYYAKH